MAQVLEHEQVLEVLIELVPFVEKATNQEKAARSQVIRFLECSQLMAAGQFLDSRERPIV